MARPTKIGLDYFPIDCDLDLDDKLGMIIAEFGPKGEMLWTKLLSWIYKNNGYYCVWDEDVQLKFLRRYNYCGFSTGFINEVVPRFIKWGLLDQTVFNTFHILTSQRIQKTWIDATRKRKDPEIDRKIWLFDVNDGNTAEETQKTAEVIDKLNKRKVKEIKEETIAENPVTPPVPPAVASQLPVVNIEKKYREMVKTKEAIFHFIRDNRPEFIEPYTDFWNVFAGEYKLPKVISVSKKRRKQFAVRIKEKDFDFPMILRKAKASNFLLTGSWFGFDWIIQNDSNYLKVLEGNYENKTVNNEQSTDQGDEQKKAVEERTRQIASGRI